MLLYKALHISTSVHCPRRQICYVFAYSSCRKKALLFNNVVAITAAVLMVLSRTAKSFEMILLGRFLYGYNVGMYDYLLTLNYFKCHNLTNFLSFIFCSFIVR